MNRNVGPSPDLGERVEDPVVASRCRAVTQLREVGLLKAKYLPRMFPGRNTRMLMTKDPSQYSPRFRYLFLGGE